MKTLSKRQWVTATVVGVNLVALGVVGTLTSAWGSELQAEQRMLPETYVAGTDVSDLTFDEAVEQVNETTDVWLQREFTFEHGDIVTSLVAADAGVSVDVESAVREALHVTEEASFVQMGQARWLSRGGASVDVPVVVDNETLEQTVGTFVSTFERAPVSSQVSWDGELVWTEDVEGYRIDSELLTEHLREAFVNVNQADVEFPVETIEANLTGEQVETVQTQVTETVNERLSRTVTVTADDETWEWHAGQFNPDVNIQELTETAAAGSITGVVFTFDDEQVAEAFEGLSETVNVAARNASVDSSSGWVEIVPERAGQAVNVETNVQTLTEALNNGAAEHTVTMDVVDADVTTDRFRQVLLLRQDQRRVYLYENGEIAADWPVAIGASSSRTPTGTFTVGAKRYQPTWYNPARDRWGADLPAVMGPGPNNPLGARALNWHTPSGHDNLIRFHGTPATSSIGTASSNGCVRMFNSDVIEMYDMVDNGTTIISTWG